MSHDMASAFFLTIMNDSTSICAAIGNTKKHSTTKNCSATIVVYNCMMWGLLLARDSK